MISGGLISRSTPFGLTLRILHRMSYGILLTLICSLILACDGNPVARLGLEPQRQVQDQLNGSIIIWHSFEGPDAEVLDSILDHFTSLHPGVTLVRETHPFPDIIEMFIEQTISGLGPDLLIIPYFLIPDYVAAGLIQDIDAYNLDTSVFLPTALSHVRFRNKLYGLPLALVTQVLCYNKSVIDEPPNTLDELVQEAESGHRVAVGSGFIDTFWGLQIFGVRIFDEHGHVDLNNENFVEWLTGLQQIRNQSNFIFYADEEALSNAFISGEVDYFACFSDRIPRLRAALGNDKVGVAPLPGDRGRPAGPVIATTALLFSRASSKQNTDLATHLAQFLTNVPQQTKLAADTESQIPVNIEVEVDERLSPIVAALVEQSKTAVSIPVDFSRKMIAVVDYGDFIYGRVLAGELTPSEAAAELTQRINRDLRRE